MIFDLCVNLDADRFDEGAFIGASAPPMRCMLWKRDLGGFMPSRDTVAMVVAVRHVMDRVR
jgi:hypothetical protein